MSFYRMDAQDLDFQDNTFDVVITRETDLESAGSGKGLSGVDPCCSSRWTAFEF